MIFSRITVKIKQADSWDSGPTARPEHNGSLREHAVSTEDPTTFLAPGQSHVVGGLDWSWAYVVFRDVPGWDGYQADSRGWIWSSWRPGRGINRCGWHRLTPQKNSGGYRHVKLRRPDAKALTRRLSRVILESFFGPCPDGMEACHGNGEKEDNRLRNLRWDTRGANLRDVVAHGTLCAGSRHGNAKLNEPAVREAKRMIALGVKPAAIGKRFNVDQATICDIKAGRTWTHVK